MQLPECLFLLSETKKKVYTAHIYIDRGSGSACVYVIFISFPQNACIRACVYVLVLGGGMRSLDDGKQNDMYAFVTRSYFRVHLSFILQSWRYVDQNSLLGAVILVCSYTCAVHNRFIPF